MRLEVTFELAKPILPKDNKSIWISFLKNILSNFAEGKYYNRYYNGTMPKDFSYTILLSHPKFEKEQIQLENTSVKMIFSADNRRKTGLIFYAALLKAKDQAFKLPGENVLTLKAVYMKNERCITSNKVVFKTVIGGGLVVREHNKENNKDYFYSFNEDGFMHVLERVLKNQLTVAKFPEYLINEVVVNVVSCKKVLVKQYGIYVDTNVGLFQVEGHPDILNYLYQAGMGSKRSMGYGLLDVVVEE